MIQRRIVSMSILIITIFSLLAPFSRVDAATKVVAKTAPKVVKKVTPQPKTSVKSATAKTSAVKKVTTKKKATKKKKKKVVHKDKINTTIAPLIDPANPY